jgi:hypothetical protein
MHEDRLRKWVFASLIVIFAAQLYLVRELFAALLLFALTSVAIVVFAGMIFLMHEGGQRAIAWVETHWRTPTVSAREFVSTPRVEAYVSALSKKPSPRPHSSPAR